MITSQLPVALGPSPVPMTSNDPMQSAAIALRSAGDQLRATPTADTMLSVREEAAVGVDHLNRAGGGTGVGALQVALGYATTGVALLDQTLSQLKYIPEDVIAATALEAGSLFTRAADRIPLRM